MTKTPLDQLSTRALRFLTNKPAEGGGGYRNLLHYLKLEPGDELPTIKELVNRDLVKLQAQPFRLEITVSGREALASGMAEPTRDASGRPIIRGLPPGGYWIHVKAYLEDSDSAVSGSMGAVLGGILDALYERGIYLLEEEIVELLNYWFDEKQIDMPVADANLEIRMPQKGVPRTSGSKVKDREIFILGLLEENGGQIESIVALHNLVKRTSQVSYQTVGNNVDGLEHAGLVKRGVANGSRPRAIYITDIGRRQLTKYKVAS